MTPSKLTEAEVTLLVEKSVTKSRHKIANDFQWKLLYFDSQVDWIKEKLWDYDKNLALQTQISHTMQKDINRIRDILEKMDTKFDKMDEKYALKTDLVKQEAIIKWAISWTITVLVWIIALIIDKYIV